MTGRLLLLLSSLVLDFFYLLFSPLLLAVLLLASRGFTRPKYRRGLLQKLGACPRRMGDAPALWVHAVSVGEVLIAQPLIEGFRERHQEWEVMLSVSTYTGAEVARQRFPGLLVFYYPLDLTPIVSTFFRRLGPRAVVLIELEVWPNFVLAARRRGIPVLVANGRMTERSSRRYRRLGPIARFLFRQVTAYGVQNDEYAGRFRELGVPEERISVLGNIKHDRRPTDSALHPDETRSLLGWNRQDGITILVAGCTHPGEETLLCSMLPRLALRDPGLRLVLAPRHVERLAPGEIQSWESPLAVVRWSEVRERNSGPLGDSILLVDTVGDLERFYGAADLVVVGGSFNPHGGHNLLEPTRLSRPTVFGPHHQNFKEEARYLLESEAAIRADGPEDLEFHLGELLESADRRRALGARAGRATARLQGSVDRHLSWLEKQL